MCESYAKSEKIDRYAPAFENSDYDFAPVVFETSGALNREGETVLKQIIRFAFKREAISHSVFAARAWARLSCCIQFAAAQQILNRDYTEPLALCGQLISCEPLWSKQAEQFDRKIYHTIFQ